MFTYNLSMWLSAKAPIRSFLSLFITVLTSMISMVYEVTLKYLKRRLGEIPIGIFKTLNGPLFKAPMLASISYLVKLVKYKI